MNNELYFHDGNFISINFDGFNGASVIEIVLLLKIEGTSDRQKYTLRLSEVARFSLLGDFSEIVKNHWAGAIEDGQIDDMEFTQRLTIKLTGGYIEIFGKINIC